MDMSLSKLQELVMDKGGLVCCDSWGRKELDTTEQLNWTEQLDLWEVHLLTLIHLFNLFSCREPAWGTLPMAEVMRKEASAYTKAGSSLKKLPVPEHLPPKPESAYSTVLCSHLHLWLYRGLSPNTSLCKGVNLGLQIINLLGVTRVSQVKPLCWQTSLCDRIIHTLATTYMIVYNLSIINSTESLEYFESLS